LIDLCEKCILTFTCVKPCEEIIKNMNFQHFKGVTLFPPVCLFCGKVFEGNFFDLKCKNCNIIYSSTFRWKCFSLSYAESIKPKFIFDYDNFSSNRMHFIIFRVNVSHRFLKTDQNLTRLIHDKKDKGLILYVNL